MASTPPEQAFLFVDGNNFYHLIHDAGVLAPMGLSYSKISLKLVLARQWVGTRYYIGAMKQEWNAEDYANQRKFLSLIEKDDPRITVHLGRIEKRPVENPLVAPLLRYIEDPKSGISPRAVDGIRHVIAGSGDAETLREKAVDVMIAVDMLQMAVAGAYDVAYLLSADGDFTPVIEAVRAHGKKVMVASPGYSSHLQRVANVFIPLPAIWFADCYR